MPVMDGVTAAKILKEDPETKEIPIIALTSYAMEENRKRFLKEGFDGYISKPIDIKEFLKTIESILRGQR